MARFKITRDESGKHTWKAVGTNPETGRNMIYTADRQERQLESIILQVNTALMRAMRLRE